MLHLSFDAVVDTYRAMRSSDEIEALVREIQETEGLSEFEALRQTGELLFSLVTIAMDWDECAAAERGERRGGGDASII